MQTTQSINKDNAITHKWLQARENMREQITILISFLIGHWRQWQSQSVAKTRQAPITFDIRDHENRYKLTF